MKRILFFDSKATGHHGEYLENIILGLPKQDAAVSLIICHPLLSDRLKQCKIDSASSIQICNLEVDEIDFIESAKNQIQRGNRELKVLEKYLIESGATSLVLMNMNVLQLALSNWKYSKRIPISIIGILFNPLTSPKIKTIENKSITGYLTHLRKKLQIFLLLRNKSIKTVFILNDSDTVDCMNSWSFSRNVFRFLIDPIPAGMRDIQVSKEKPKQNKQFNFIMVGAMSPRKGCLEVIKALNRANFPNGMRVSLQLMGAFSKEYPEYEELLVSEIESLKLVRNDVNVIIENKFIDNETFCQEISHSDCVLAPYIKFNGSSGMIGHACRYQKPMIVSCNGLIGNIVESKQLGLCVDSSDIDALAIAIEKMIRSDFEYSSTNAKTYFEDASHFQFARNLIK